MLTFLQLSWKTWMRFGVMGKFITSVLLMVFSFTILSRLVHRVKLLKTIGNFVAAVFLVTFYFTIFSLFALPLKLLNRQFQPSSQESTWVKKEKTIQSLQEFQYEH